MKNKILVFFLAGVFLLAVAARGYAGEAKPDMRRSRKTLSKR